MAWFGSGAWKCWVMKKTASIWGKLVKKQFTSAWKSGPSCFRDFRVLRVEDKRKENAKDFGARRVNKEHLLGACCYNASGILASQGKFCLLPMLMHEKQPWGPQKPERHPVLACYAELCQLPGLWLIVWGKRLSHRIGGIHNWGWILLWLQGLAERER